MGFWKRVEAKRVSQNTTYRWIAENVIQKSETTVSGWRSNNVLPRADDALKIAQALGTTVEFLVTGEQPLMILPADRRLLESACRYRPIMEDLDYLDTQLRTALVAAIASAAETSRKQHAANTANA